MRICELKKAKQLQKYLRRDECEILVDRIRASLWRYRQPLY